MALPQHFWSRAGITCAVIAGVVAMLFMLPIAFGLFWSMFTDQRIIITNDTQSPIEINKIWQSADDGRFRYGQTVTLQPGVQHVWESDDLAAVRCIAIDGHGTALLDAASVAQDDRFTEVITTQTWTNIFGKEIVDVAIDVSHLMERTESLPCPWLDKVIER